MCDKETWEQVLWFLLEWGERCQAYLTSLINDKIEQDAKATLLQAPDSRQ